MDKGNIRKKRSAWCTGIDVGLYTWYVGYRKSIAPNVHKKCFFLNQYIIVQGKKSLLFRALRLALALRGRAFRQKVLVVWLFSHYHIKMPTCTELREKLPGSLPRPYPGSTYGTKRCFVQYQYVKAWEQQEEKDQKKFLRLLIHYSNRQSTNSNIKMLEHTRFV